eukprot:Opistho-1_new@61732
MTGTNIAYTWDMGDGSPLRCGSQVTYDYAAKGSYAVTVTAWNSVTQPDSFTRTVTVLAGKGSPDGHATNCTGAPTGRPAPAPAATTTAAKTATTGAAPKTATTGAVAKTTGKAATAAAAPTTGNANPNPVPNPNPGSADPNARGGAQGAGSSSSSGGGVSVGAIAGGVVGGLLAIAAVVGIVIYVKRSRGKGYDSQPRGRRVSEVELQSTNVINVLHNPMNTAPEAPAKPKPPRAAAGGPKQQRAAYAYSAQSADELELAPGDVIAVTHEGNDGWNTGKNMRTGKTGVYPASYC